MKGVHLFISEAMITIPIYYLDKNMEQVAETWHQRLQFDYLAILFCTDIGNIFLLVKLGNETNTVSV